MRQVELAAVIRATPVDTVFEELVKFERYPDLAPHVRSTAVYQTLPDREGRSSWELHFRSGLLRWTERELFMREAARIEFEQLSGDFDRLTGCWTLRQEGADCSLRFQAEFDFGIPSLEGILDPIAERVIKETVAWVVVGLFSGAELAGEPDLLTAAPRAGTPDAGIAT
jgi:ribosome-associated toxin RatA of RatAB toxin-antitoxin module